MKKIIATKLFVRSLVDISDSLGIDPVTMLDRVNINYAYKPTERDRKHAKGLAVKYQGQYGFPVLPNLNGSKE